MNKLLSHAASLCFLLIMVLCFNNIVFAADDFSGSFQDGYKPNILSLNKLLADKMINDTVGSTRVTARIPQLTGFDSEEQNQVNEVIYGIYQQKLDEANSAKSLEMDYEFKIYGSYITLILKTTTTTSVTKMQVDTLTIDLEKIDLQKPISELFIGLNDVLGVNGVLLANRFIVSEILREPAKYNDSFEGIDENADFYVENGKAVILFDEYEIAPGNQGIVSFEIDLVGILEYKISKNNYYTKDAYGLKMLPLRAIAEGFGFSVHWNDSSSTTIIRNSFFTSVSLNKNSYFKGRMAARQLEVAPETKNGITYVPISFFTEILDLDYSIDDAGQITFSEYRPVS